MQDVNIRDRCRINTNRDSDTFVGIQCVNGDFEINFPLGFHLADDDKTLRKDILMLVNTIATTTGRKESVVSREYMSEFELGIPIQAYIYVIYDYFNRGYYRERESHYSSEMRGKINWSRTIKTQKPYIQDDEAYYLRFVTKKNLINDNELISQIHEYCVYESFQTIGWLFSPGMPRKPEIKYNKKLFVSVVKNKYQQTFDDRNKRLFRNMLTILESEFDPSAAVNYRYGTNRFEYVWEALIDRVFGISGKKDFFPKTAWVLHDGTYDNACLEPDSIMIWGDKLFVLDAKYYKYGATRRPWDLPESTSINKQITYGEFIDEQKKYDESQIYNAFLMPFDSKDPIWDDSSDIQSIGMAVSSWKKNEKKYEKIQGILVDVRYLMRLSAGMNDAEIEKLAECIEKAFA